MVLAGCVRQIMFERGVLNWVARRFLDVRMDVNVSPPDGMSDRMCAAKCQNIFPNICLEMSRWGSSNLYSFFFPLFHNSLDYYNVCCVIPIMWVKQCHVYHPPVTTIFIGGMFTIAMGGMFKGCGAPSSQDDQPLAKMAAKPTAVRDWEQQTIAAERLVRDPGRLHHGK